MPSYFSVMKILKIIYNELKKFVLILFLTLVAILLSIVPIFYPIALLIYATLLAAQFLDYSWSRYDYSPSECIKNIFSSLLTYSIAGAIFLALVSVPFVNAMVPAIATSYFTVLWIKKNKQV